MNLEKLIKPISEIKRGDQILVSDNGEDWYTIIYAFTHQGIVYDINNHYWSRIYNGEDIVSLNGYNFNK